MNRMILSLFALAALAAAPVRAANADATGLVPTIWWDFETKPGASGLPGANKGSASISFTSEGTATYQAGVTNGWAVNTASFTPYSGAGSFSTAGNSFTVSLVMTLGTTANGITWNLRNATASKDLVVRRGTTAGSLLVGVGPQAQTSSSFLEATFPDGDAAWHLVSVVVEPAAMSLYVDGVLEDSTTEFTLGSNSGYASQMQLGSHLNGAKSPEAKGGGLVDDFRIHDAALTPLQIVAIAAEYGLATLDGYIAVSPSGEPAVGTDSFRAPFVLRLNEGDAAEAAIVYGTDAALSAPSTNVVGSALPAGAYEASLTGLASGTTYWWKIVVTNGVNRAETAVASFRTLDAVVPTDYAKRIPIAVSGYSGTETLTNFPVLVTLAADSPLGFDYADCAEDGADLRFADADGALAPHEIELWDTNGTSYVWVRVPRLPPAGAALALYYGADPAGLPAVVPADVWTRYAAVFHGGSTIADATGKSATVNANTVTGSASGGKAGGVMSKAQQGATGVQFSNPVTSGAMSSATQASVSGWYKRSNSGNTVITAANVGTWGNGGFLALVEAGSYFSVAVSGTHQGTTGQGALTKDVWGHLAFACDGSNVSSYFNGTGIYSGSKGKTMSDPGQTYWAIGSYSANGTDGFIGDMDEVRFFNGVASADWFKAEYDSVADPAAFAALSPAESTDPDLPRFGALSASDANGVATFAVPLAVPGWGGEVPTAVSVFYGTDGEHWTELSLGSTNEMATLAGSVSGLTAAVRYLWYAVATATSGGTPKTTTSQQQSFVARAFDPTGDYRSFTATVVWDGAPAENLPFLLRISEGGVNGFDYDDVTASGLEIVDADGHLLPFEIDTWDTNGESLVWVLPPVYKDGATVTVRYGAPFANAPLAATNVWNAYIAVWHMNEILEDTSTGTHYTPDSSASGWHAYKSDEADTVLSPVTTAPGASANPTPLTGTAMNIAYGAGKSSSSLGGFRVPAAQTSSTTLNGPGFTLSAIVNSQQIANSGRCRVIAFGNEYNDKANFAVGSDKVYCMGTGDNSSHNKPHSKGATGWVYAADVFDSPLSKIYADGVRLSANNEGNPNLASLTLDKGVGLGCFTDGKQCLDGYLDEARIRNAASTTDWIAAEYHTLADGAVSFSSVSSSDTSAPVLGIPSVAGNADGSFTVSVEVSENAPDSIVCTVGGTDYAMTNAAASLPATYSATVSGLAPGTYVVSVHATAASGTVVSSTCPDAFHAGALSIAKLSDADEGMLTPGVFRVSRADADPTGLPALTFDVAFSGAGFAAIADPGISTATIPAGAAYVDISVTPIPNDAVNENLELVLTVSGSHVGQSSTGSLTVVNASFDLAVRYVSPSGNDANSGGTPESPKKTIAAAVAALGPIAPTRTCTVHVAPGLYPITSPIVVTNAVCILGDDPDPSRTFVSNTAGFGWNNQNQRCFMVDYADAVVANLTMQKGGVDYSAHGGNFFVGSAGGTVSNCVVEGGGCQLNVYAAGGRLEGGLVTHTIFRKNVCDSDIGNWQGQHGGVLELVGSSRAENCLLVDNPQYQNVYLVLVGDSAVMRNCTIADSSLAKTNQYCNVFSALRITSANATVLNTVIAGVTNKVDGLPCPPTGAGVAKFLHGAFDGDATDLPEGTVVGTAESFFRKYAASNYRLKYQPRSGGPLYDKGADYAPMAAFDLSGVQKRIVGSHVDIGCYEGDSALTLLLIK